jgi:hypothetical protein
MNNALQMMVRCVTNLTDAPDQKWKRVQGGFDAIQPQLPIYFRDAEYRYRRHELMRQIVVADDVQILTTRNGTAS